MVWNRLSRERLEETKRHFAPSGPDVQKYVMALEVIRHALGPEWWKKNCTHDSSGADKFFCSSGHAAASVEESRQVRIIQMGHCLYALQDCRGYDAFLHVLQSRDLEPAFFELWAASILQDDGFEVEFVQTTGRRGEDYDLLVYKDRIRICVEAKSRYAGIALSGETLKNTLVKARKQLPQDGPNVIVISIPSDWTLVPEVETVISECIAGFFRSSARVNRVVFFWDHWMQAAEGRGLACYVREYENPRPKTPLPLIPFVATEIAPFTALSFW